MRKELTKLQLMVRSQHSMIEGLHEAMAQKQEEVDSLEASNGTLRRQALQSVSQEEKARQ